MKVYCASSWRNEQQPAVVAAFRDAGHEVYDFRHPTAESRGFSWREIDPEWKNWWPAKYREALSHPIAQAGFRSDWEALRDCDACVLVQPCGRSAHLELGWAAGAGKRTLILLADGEPELMALLADAIALSVEEAVAIVDYWEKEQPNPAHPGLRFYATPVIK